MKNERNTYWTIETYAIHNEAMRRSEKKFQKERDRRYAAIDKANKATLAVALIEAAKAADKAEQALKEYKESANEWRKTVSDLISMQQGGSKGMRDMWGWLIASAIAGATLFNIFLK